MLGYGGNFLESPCAAQPDHLTRLFGRSQRLRHFFRRSGLNDIHDDSGQVFIINYAALLPFTCARKSASVAVKGDG